MADEKRLIDVNDALEQLCKYCNCGCYEECDYRCSEFYDISNIPAVDAVEVVRCKECKHSEIFDTLLYCDHTRGLAGMVLPNGFCYLGERRNDGNL